MPATKEKPRLAIFTHVVRADFHNELRHFRHFEIWHFYRYRAKDLPSAELGPRAVRFSGLLDLVVKALRTKPALIQGGEPYDFPTQLTIVLATFVVAGLLRVPYYYPTFENIPIHTKYSAVRRMGIPLGPLVVTFLRWLARTYASKSILVFAPNSGARRNIREAGVPPERTSNLLYATWGVDLELFTPKRNGREPNLGENAILYVGRLTLSKGIDYLLQAFLAVTQIVPDARLFLIGEGEMVSEVREFAARHSTASSIHLLGPMPNHNLPPYFRAARVTASPSITTARWAEQVGMVNIQSMACGTPVVSTQSGAIPEFVENGRNGILVPERDSTALAEALLRLLTDRQLQAHFAVNARAYAVQRYDASRNVAAVETMLVERMTALRRAASR
jgi:glycosyltransferase involved in cell wall biosynthesis